MLIGYKRGQGSIVIRIKVLNSSVATGAGLTGLTSASGGLIISTIADNESTATAYTVAGSTIETITTLGTFAAPTATKCRFKEVDSSGHKGIYELQIADARYAVSSAKSLLISLSGAALAAETDVVIPLRDLDPYDAVRAGLTSLPNTAVSTNASLLTSGTGTDQISVSSGKVLLQATQTGVTIPTVTTVGTLTTYTGNTPQTGDAYAIVNDSGFGNAKLVRSTTPANTLDVSSTGEAGLDFSNIKDATGAHTLTNITVPTVTTATNLTNAPTSGDFTSTMKTSLNASTPASVVGAVGSVAAGGISSTSFAAGAIDAAAIAADAIGSSELAASAVAEIAAGVFDLATSGHTTSGTFGAAVVAAGSVGDPWATALPGAYGAGTAGNIVGTNLDAAVTTRMATYAQPTGFLAATFPASLASPTNITAGTITTATNVTTLNGLAADVITAASIATDAGAEIAAAVRDVSNGSPAAGSLGEAARNADAKAAVIIIALGTPAVTVSDDIAAVAGSTWDLATSGHTTSGTFGAAIIAAGSAGDPWTTNLPGSYGAGTAGNIVGTNLNATIGSRSTYSGGAVSGVTGDVGGKVLGGGSGTILATGVWALDGFGNASVPQTADVGDLIPARLVMTAGKVWALDGNGDAIAPAATALSNATWTGAKAAFLDAAVSSRLAPTVAGRTLDVSVTGEAGIDWANVGSPATALNLSGTTISTGQVVGSVSGAVGSVTGAVGSVTGAVGSLSGAVTLDLSQTGLAPRDLGSVADASLTVGDALVAAICAAAGKQNIVSTSYSVHTPHDNTLIRTFVLDSASVPTSRT